MPNEKIAKENMSKGGEGSQISDNLRTDNKVAEEVGLGNTIILSHLSNLVLSRVTEDYIFAVYDITK